GTYFWANVEITAMRGRSGNLIGFGMVTRDLTAQREVEGATRQSEQKLRLLFDSVQDYAIFSLDVDGCVRSWNIGAARIKGYRANEIIGRHFSVFYPEEELRAGTCERLLG